VLYPYLRLDRHLFIREPRGLECHLWIFQWRYSRIVHDSTGKLDDGFIEDGLKVGHDFYDFGILYPYRCADCGGADRCCGWQFSGCATLWWDDHVAWDGDFDCGEGGQIGMGVDEEDVNYANYEFSFLWGS
jgi:hypothetical protein